MPIDDRLDGQVQFAVRAESAGIPRSLLRELWELAQAGSFGLSEVDFELVLTTAGTKYNFGLPPGEGSSSGQRTTFYRGLHLKEVALAHGCALGRDVAWQYFLETYEAALKQAAIGITGSSSLGEDLAGALYSELFGLTERDGVRRSPLASYSGRGSLMGWLRATLAQRHVDHHRRTHREMPLDGEDFAAEAAMPASPSAELLRLSESITSIFATLSAEDRFLLSSYFLDGRTLQRLATLLRVHEATTSRHLKKLTREVRKRLLKDLQRRGMSRAAAEETLGTDPRDLDINLRSLLQASPPSTFSQQAGKK